MTENTTLYKSKQLMLASTIIHTVQAVLNGIGMLVGIGFFMFITIGVISSVPTTMNIDGYRSEYEPLFHIFGGMTIITIISLLFFLLLAMCIPLIASIICTITGWKLHNKQYTSDQNLETALYKNAELKLIFSIVCILCHACLFTSNFLIVLLIIGPWIASLILSAIVMSRLDKPMKQTTSHATSSPESQVIVAGDKFQQNDGISEQ